MTVPCCRRVFVPCRLCLVVAQCRHTRPMGLVAVIATAPVVATLIFRFVQPFSFLRRDDFYDASPLASAVFGLASSADMREQILIFSMIETQYTLL